MKRFLKSLVPFTLFIGILFSIGWYLMEYDREFTRDFLIAQARYFDARGNVDFATRLYDLAYEYTGQDDDVAIELANQYKADGNYTKAEVTLTHAIAERSSVDLYIALCKTYVEQDKLLDAVALLDNIDNPAMKMEMDRIRPALPETTAAPGLHNEYIVLDFVPADGRLLCTTDGDYPSVRDAAFSEVISLPAGETVVHALRIGDNGLVSPLTLVSFTIGGVIEEARFTDAAIELALREMLKIDPEDPVMTDRLWEVSEFTVPEEANSLADLAYLPYLAKLTVTDRSLTSLEPLASLQKLSELDLSGCRFSAAELEVLTKLPQLQKLNLSDCGLSSINALTGANRLVWLDLSGNTLRNLASLSEMVFLQELYLQHNAVTGLDALSTLKRLNKLDLSYNSVQDLTPLTQCLKLTWLNAGNNQIAALDGLDQLTGLTSLYLNRNKLTNVNVLQALTELTTLNLSDNEITDIDSLAALVNLVELHCSNNKLTRLPGWPQELPLSILDISHNQISSLKPLAKMEELTYVYLDYNQLTTLNDIADCYRLVMVSAFGNTIKDVSKLTEHNIIVNYDPTN